MTAGAPQQPTVVHSSVPSVVPASGREIRVISTACPLVTHRADPAGWPGRRTASDGQEHGSDHPVGRSDSGKGQGQGIRWVQEATLAVLGGCRAGE